ncbi:MAG: M20 family metallo-hydrolase, partial [Spirochaetaceae bacterium]|nr:M20 family metallo-hydrolase [Spirochaetaceae bacterium]
GGEGEFEKCKALEKWLEKNGFTGVERFDAPDPRVPSGVRPTLVVTIPGRDSSRAVWIMSHTDVVPVGELSLWNTDPWRVIEKEGRIYGRGVEDNQQGLVSSIFAARAFIEEKLLPVCTVKLLFVADEEVGSACGIRYLLENHALFGKDDIIVIPDGGDTEGTAIEVAEKNLLWLRIIVKGKQTHGSRPDEGANAHLAGAALALSLNEMETFFDKRDRLFHPDKSTFQPTKQEVNVPNINTIPGEDVFYMDCRILPCYTLDTVRSEILRRIAAVERKYGVSITFTEEQAVESPATPVDAPVVKALSRAIKQVYGKEPHPVGVGGGTVAAYLRKSGFNAAVWSRVEDTAHQPNENCIIDNLIGDAGVMAFLMLNADT